MQADKQNSALGVSLHRLVRRTTLTVFPWTRSASPSWSGVQQDQLLEFRDDSAERQEDESCANHASGAEAWRLQDRDADGFIDGGRENFERRIDGILRGDEDARG